MQTLTLNEAKALKYIESIGGVPVGESFPLNADYYPPGVTPGLCSLANKGLIETTGGVDPYSRSKNYRFTDETVAAYSHWYETKGWKLKPEQLVYGF